MSEEKQILERIAQQLASDAREREERRDGWAKLILLVGVSFVLVSWLGPFSWPAYIAVAVVWIILGGIKDAVAARRAKAAAKAAFIGPRRPENWREGLAVSGLALAAYLLGVSALGFFFQHFKG
jgi:hypothetical protein